MNRYQKTHPLAILAPAFLVGKTLLIPVILASLVVGPVVFVLSGILLGVVSLLSFLSWRKTTYLLGEETFILRMGFLNKREIRLPRTRILGVGRDQTFVQRLFRVVTFRLETLGTNEENEVSLWMGLDASERLEYSLFPKKEGDTPSHGLSLTDLLWMGATSSSVLVGFGVLYGLYYQLDDLFPSLSRHLSGSDLLSGLPSLFRSIGDNDLSLSVLLDGVLSLFLVIGISWVVGSLVEIVRHANYRIERHGDDLKISRGLFSTHEVVVPVSRIQTLHIKESPLRQLIRRASLSVDCTGYGAKKGASPVLFPYLRQKDIDPFLRRFLPEFRRDVALSREEPFVVIYHLLGYVVPFLLIVFLVYPFLPFVVWSLLFLPWIAYKGWLSHRDTGFAISGDMLVLRRHRLARETMFFPMKSLQSFSFRVHRLQEWGGIGDIEVAVASDLTENLSLFRHLSLTHMRRLDEMHKAYRGQVRSRQSSRLSPSGKS